MPGEFVSAVDAGNLALALTVCAQCARMQLRQAREEYRSVPVRLDALRGRMQLRRLYDARRHLFFIGYDGANARMSEGHYDLLVSESVMLSFAAIMAGEAPEKHWWYLGRAWMALPQKALLSWSGTMFEYLMGALLLPSYPGSTLSAAQHACVRARSKSMDARAYLACLKAAMRSTIRSSTTAIRPSACASLRWTAAVRAT